MIKLAHINTALDEIDMFEPVITIRDFSASAHMEAAMCKGEVGERTVALNTLQVAILYQFFQDLVMAHQVTQKYRWHEVSINLLSNASRQYHWTQEDLDRELEKERNEGLDE